jgi:hypothetical protein
MALRSASTSTMKGPFTSHQPSSNASLQTACRLLAFSSRTFSPFAARFRASYLPPRNNDNDDARDAVGTTCRRGLTPLHLSSLTLLCLGFTCVPLMDRFCATPLDAYPLSFKPDVVYLIRPGAQGWVQPLVQPSCNHLNKLPSVPS